MTEQTEGIVATEEEIAAKNAERDRAQERRDNAAASKKAIDAKIKRLKEVKKKLGGGWGGSDGYDGELRTQHTRLKAHYNEKLDWVGETFDDLHEVEGDWLIREAESVRKNSTGAAVDALVDAISELEDESTHYWGIIEACDDAIRAIGNWFDKLVN